MIGVFSSIRRLQIWDFIRGPSEQTFRATACMLCSRCKQGVTERNKSRDHLLTSLDLPLSIYSYFSILATRPKAALLQVPFPSTISILLPRMLHTYGGHFRLNKTSRLDTAFRRAFRLAYSPKLPGRLSHSSRYSATMPGSQINSIADEPQTPTFANLPSPPKRRKLTGRAFYESLGSPKTILAPMVDQSEFVRCFIRPLWLRTALTRRFRPGACSPGPT